MKQATRENFSVPSQANRTSSVTSDYIPSSTSPSMVRFRPTEEIKPPKSRLNLGQKFSTPKLSKSSDDYLLSSTEEASFHSFNTYMDVDPSEIGIREFLYRVASLKDTYRLHFKKKFRLSSQTSVTYPAGIEAIFAIQELEDSFRPENVIPPSSDFQPGLNMLHNRLDRLNVEVHEWLLELQQKRDVLLAGDFIRWVYEQYPVQGTRMEITKHLFRRNVDLHVSKRAIESAISKYRSIDSRTDKTPTGIMTDVIVEKLQQYLSNYCANRKPVREMIRSWVRERISRSEDTHVRVLPVLISPKSEDLLLVEFPEACVAGWK